MWRGHIQNLCGRISVLRTVLTEEENQKANRFRFEEDRARFILGRGCLRVLLGGYQGIPPERVSLEFTSYGKPHIQGEEPIHFNVSHSGEYFLIALSGHPVGIDIELHHPRPHLLQIAQRFFSQPEWQYLESLVEEEQMPGFYRIWTRKEAFIKGVGQGLSYPLRAFSTLNTKGEVVILPDVDVPQAGSAGWFVQDLEATKGYSAAVATLGGRYKVTQEPVAAVL